MPQSAAAPGSPSAADLRAAFDRAEANTVGIEDEVMLLDPVTLGLAPRAREVMAVVGDDRRFKLELPAAQLEIVTSACAGVEAAAAELRAARSALAQATDGLVRLAAAGVHPFSPGCGELNLLPRYAETIRQYGPVARRQLVSALQVHVALGNSDSALAVYNAVRSYLPYVAALAANAPYYEGVDTGLASVRPKLCELLPRQGVPPALVSWEAYADALSWGARSGAFATPQTWWWELRLHPTFGTLEFRVPDAQSAVVDAAAVAAFVQALVVWLAERHSAGDELAVAPRWRIEENRWSALRHGVEGTMADLQTGAQRPTRVALFELLEVLAPFAERRGGGRALEHAWSLVEVNGAIAQRRVSKRDGAPGAARWLAERFSS